MGGKKLILISGGSGGIGKLLLKNLSKKYKILYLYNRNKPSFIKSARYLKIDFSNLKQVKNACAKLKKMTFPEKKIIYLNLAATKNDKISINIRMKELSETFNVNCFSLFQIIQAILPNLIKNKWGRVINISSTGGLAGEIGTMLYTSSKNATQGMINVLAKEYAKFNITFNTIVLGNFDTGMYKKLTEKSKVNILKKIPSGKTGDIKSVYNAIEFIINSEYVNGSKVSVDGAFNAQ